MIKKKLEIAKWYKNLSDEHREFVDIIRSRRLMKQTSFTINITTNTDINAIALYK